MIKKFQLLLVLLVLPFASIVAQQPFEEYGYKVKVATLSKGKYQEFFDQDSLVQVGSVVLNVNSGKIVYFVVYDTTYSEATLEPEIISRWLSPDPLADEFYDYSPYNFVYNNPIRFTDPTGMAPEDGLLGKIVTTVMNFLFGGNEETEQSAAEYGNAVEQGQAYSAMIQENHQELRENVEAIPGIGAIGNVMDAQQANTTGEVVEHSLKAVVNVNSIPISGGGKGGGGGKYSSVPEPKNVGAGKKFTQTQKANLLEANRKANNGVLKSDLSGKPLDSPVQSKKGVKANMNQAEVDHVKAKSKGGTNSNSNAQILSKQENLKKRDN